MGFERPPDLNEYYSLARKTMAKKGFGDLDERCTQPFKQVDHMIETAGDLC